MKHTAVFPHKGWIMEDEIWKDIPGYEGIYKISTNGRIINCLTGKIRKDVKSGKGYRAIQLSDANHKKHRHYIHRLVATAFLGGPSSPDAQVNHKNCNKSDNSLKNLEWTTPRENMTHAYFHGRVDYRRPLRKDNKTGVNGICNHSGGYEVTFCGKYVGWYKTLEKAICARKKVEKQYGNKIAEH